jgi:hypothetical protein
MKGENMKILSVGKFTERSDGTWEIVGWNFDGNIPTEHADIEEFKAECKNLAKEAGTYVYEWVRGWRPEGWENPHSVGLQFDAFESGADTMLRLLKEKGTWMTPEQMKLLAPDRKYPYGYIVFIPSEKATHSGHPGMRALRELGAGEIP